ncbi:hypothetical protein G4X40_19810 [Rhodococcus sp. D2-41]|uniref:VIT1/CCC1 transporter family protein n=1 Tax=Speluncibacter jeojiensis TaxID=2710754 RepID=UPI00241042EA|nr:VIT1/CCC1 transporter family protein [Rhodococcus sp. D2-41]MDG3012390.1 hypothetical protein [Rhodococcus sp. D2-41]
MLSKLNWLRAAVLGANDGIVSTAGVILAVASATANRNTILTAAIAALVAGAVSMALGEYVSVAAQRDAEQAAHDTELVNPAQAAISSAASFTVGAALPTIAVLLAPATGRITVTYIAVMLALAITGTLSARWTHTNTARSVARIVIGGALALAATIVIGSLI